MNILATLPAWVVGLLALGAGAMLLLINYGWLLAAKAMLERYRRKDDSASDAPAVDCDKPAQISGG